MKIKQIINKNAAFLLFLLAGATACEGLEETVTIDVGQTERRLVIDGLILDELTDQYVRLTWNTGFYSNEVQTLSGASVLVEDDAGNSWNLTESASEPGMYQATFEGQRGTTYNLSVNVEGQLYQASETLQAVTEIDSLGWRIDFDEFDDPDEEGEFYEVLLYANEPQDSKDFYLFQFYRNGELQNEGFDEVYFTDDEFLQERIDGIPTGYYYALGDTVVVEIYSITSNAFVFYGDLLNSLTNDGGMFSPIPANLRNNLSNGAIGYFRASAVERDTIVVKED